MSERPILVTGGAGQLASALSAASSSVHRVGRPNFDFDRPESIDAAFRAANPSLVVNAAAYTAVDAAESDADAAYRANRDGPSRLAGLCASAGVPMIHISTDYVYDGAKGAPYTEADAVSPTGIYGASKLAGEQAVLASGARAIVLRTSWVHYHIGRNFVRTMLTIGKTRDRLTVVADQRGCPTAAADLADAILSLAARIRDGWRAEYAGVFHAAGGGDTSWHGLACAVFADAAAHGWKVPRVDPIATADWPTPAKRPADSRLDCGRLDLIFGVRLPHWRDGLRRTTGAIFADGEI
jgi:dTDP-4-dehydrorhamnose reductase